MHATIKLTPLEDVLMRDVKDIQELVRYAMDQSTGNWEDAVAELFKFGLLSDEHRKELLKNVEENIGVEQK